jgi:acyl-CoA reductase-like NAD-dependent aldehyde dehydrogenase
LNKLYVQESIVDIVQKKLELRFSKIKYGNHLDKCNDYGPMVNSVDLETLEKTIKTQTDEFGLSVKQFKSAENVSVFPPTIVKNAALNSPLNLNEVNGPYVMLIPFRTVKESSWVFWN